MSDFLSTTGVSHHLEQIIRDAEETLWLISPFLKVNLRLKQLIREVKSSVDARLVYGRVELSKEEMLWLADNHNLSLFVCKNLHAKCYMNEKAAIITSLNLYEHSQVNNYEMGILVTLQDDPEIYHKISREARSIIDASTRENRGNREAVVQEVTVYSGTVYPWAHCIACSDSIPGRVQRPFCEKCFYNWAFEGRDPAQRFGYCHFCGRNYICTVSNPRCSQCTEADTCACTRSKGIQYETCYRCARG